MKKSINLMLKCFLMNLVIVMSACNLAPGSYPYAEEYEVNLNEPALIESIKKFKINNPQYNVPEEIQLKDGRNDEQDLWYHIYFYFPDENQILYTWTRTSGKQTTTFALVSINQGLIIGKWKEINKDFSDEEKAADQCHECNP